MILNLSIYVVAFVQNHIVKGSYFSSSLQDGQELVTEADLDLQVTVRHSKYTLQIQIGNKATYKNTSQ